MKIPSALTPRKRALSDEEKKLWRAVAKSAKPLTGRRPRELPVVDEPAAEAESPRRERAKPVRPTKESTLAKPSPPPLVQLPRRERAQIAKGRKPIEARIDLHGMTQARAHRALVAFLHRAHDDGAAVVLVITGKGRTVGAESERGILRRQVPLWLSLSELRGLVVGFESAHATHGGDGALYVRLRRAR